jgi:DNA mismatch repair protein MutS
VARLAGVPLTVIEQAKVLLNDMDNGRFGEKYLQAATHLAPVAAATRARQMSLFRDDETAFLAELKELNVDQMTPIEALTLLNELIEKARAL